MGTRFSLFRSRQRQRPVLMLGLDMAGKSTILYRLSFAVNTIIPTIGFNVEPIHFTNIKFIIWEIGGHEGLRGLWKYYTKGMQGLIFVVDSTDVQRLEDAKFELFNILQQKELESTPLLVLANKQDLPLALSANEIEKILNVNTINDRHTAVMGCCGTSGAGLETGLGWLKNPIKFDKQRTKLSKKKKKKNAFVKYVEQMNEVKLNNNADETKSIGDG